MRGVCAYGQHPVTSFSHYLASYMYSAILLIVFMSSRGPHTMLSRGGIGGEILPGIGACIMNSAYTVAIKQAVPMARYATKPLLRRCSGTYLGTLGWWMYVPVIWSLTRLWCKSASR